MKTTKLYEYKGAGKKPGKKDRPIAEFRLSSPVVVMANKLATFLAAFPGVATEFNSAEQKFRVYVADPDKIDAFRFFLRRRHEFGNLALDVELYAVGLGRAELVDKAAYKVTEDERVRLFQKMFEASPYVPTYGRAVDPAGVRWNFFVFPSWGVTYQADSLRRLDGCMTELCADVVRDVFDASDMRIA